MKALKEVLASVHICLHHHACLVEATPAEKLHFLLSRKHTERSSPITSPLQSTRSPYTKRARTFAEAEKHHSKNVSDMEINSIRQSLASNSSGIANTVQFESFQITASEQSAVDSLNENLFNYVIVKERSAPDTDKLLVDLKTFWGMTLPSIPKVQCSNVVYLPVVDLHADSTEAMEVVVAILHKEYGIGETADYLAVAYLAWSSGCWSTPLSSGTTASSVPQHKYCQ